MISGENLLGAGSEAATARAGHKSDTSGSGDISRSSTSTSSPRAAVPLGLAADQIDAALKALEAAKSSSAKLPSSSSGGGRPVGVGHPTLSGLMQQQKAEAQQSKEVLALARALSAQGTLKGFGTASQVPRRAYTVDELRLHKIDTANLLAPKDSTLGQVRSRLQLAALGGLIATWQLLPGLDQFYFLGGVLALLTLGVADQIGTGGALEGLAIDTIGQVVSKKYRERVARHEAGHFLIAYLLGVLPASYTISSLDALQRTGALTGQQAGTTLVDVEWQEQMQSGQITSPLLDVITCVALAGVCSEYITFGVAEGGISDIMQLDSLFMSLRFTQKKSDEVVRWAVLNTVTLLRSRKKALDALAEGMQARRSVGECIAIIERELEAVPA